MKRHSYQAGVGLIEVLIAVLVLAVGLLGMVSMQVTAKRNSYEATQRSIATALARDIIERIRVNPPQLATYDGQTLGGGSISTAPSSCNTSPCSTAALASRDLYEWEQSLDGAAEKIILGGTTSNAGGLVDPTACIDTTTGGVSGSVTIAIAWKGVAELTNPTESTCGESSGLYGASNEQRRLLVITTYVSDA